jgi:dihydrolipoamide dehydrogenase
MLAHKAEEEGVAVAERIAGQHGQRRFQYDPQRHLHQPRDCLVGRTEQQLKEQGTAYRIGSFPFMATAARVRWATRRASSR